MESSYDNLQASFGLHQDCKLSFLYDSPSCRWCQDLVKLICYLAEYKRGRKQSRLKGWQLPPKDQPAAKRMELGYQSLTLATTCLQRRLGSGFRNQGTPHQTTISARKANNDASTLIARGDASAVYTRQSCIWTGLEILQEVLSNRADGGNQNLLKATELAHMMLIRIRILS